MHILENRNAKVFYELYTHNLRSLLSIVHQSMSLAGYNLDNHWIFLFLRPSYSPAFLTLSIIWKTTLKYIKKKNAFFLISSLGGVRGAILYHRTPSIVTSHSAYAATETESNGAKIDGLLPRFFSSFGGVKGNF